MNKYLFKINVAIRGDQRKAERKGKEGEVFTGKLVKSLIIDGNPSLKRFFEKTSGNAPKLIHATPIYRTEMVKTKNGEKEKVVCIHKYGDLWKVGTNKFAFYIGIIESNACDSPSFDDIYNALLNISGRHQFKTSIIDIELISVETIDAIENAKNIIKGLLEKGKLKVIFSSPTLLRDPIRTSKYKSLTPTPMNIFSTPVYINLYLTNKLKRQQFIKTLTILHRLLNEPHSMYKTTKVIRVKYDENKNPIPALAGYINLFLNPHYYNLYKPKIDIEKLLEETLSTMMTLGTGTSRATGFGHIKLETPTSGISKG